MTVPPLATNASAATDRPAPGGPRLLDRVRAVMRARHLLVFYLPDQHQWQEAVNRMVAAGYEPVPSFNPYWDRAGRTFQDPDGYRIVLQSARWSG